MRAASFVVAVVLLCAALAGGCDDPSAGIGAAPPPAASHVGPQVGDRSTRTQDPDPSQAVSAAIAATSARSADAFVDTIGVNTHLQYNATVYGTRFDEVIRPRLQELGARYVRDHVQLSEHHDGSHFFYERLRALADDGVRFSLITDIEDRQHAETPWHLLDEVAAWSGGAVWAFEGANEPDGFSGLPRAQWSTRVRTAQQRLWKKARSDPALADVAVLGPSLRTMAEQWPALGDLSGYLDYGNWHPYQGGAKPSLQGGVHRLEDQESGPQLVSGDKPLVVTETGYHTAVGQRSAGHAPTSERAVGIYLPRLFLEHFDRGYVRTFVYELIDVGPDPRDVKATHNFGLLDNSGEPKPAYLALRNLIDLLEDPGADFTPGSLAYRVHDAPEDLRSTLLAKRDGSFFLVLWRDVSVWDRVALRDLPVADQRATLHLAEPAASVIIHRPSRGPAAVSSATDVDVLPIDVGADISVVEIR